MRIRLGLTVALLMATLVSTGSRAQDTTAAPPTPTPQHTTTSNLSLILNVNLSSDSHSGNEVLSADWLSSLSAKVFMDGEPDQFAGRIDATYGEHVSELVPQKTQDNVIVSITPSRTVVPGIGLRLFLEVAAETQFTQGLVDTTVTNFLDPLFLYQSLFLGKRLTSNSDDGLSSFNLTAGLGYALQQTMANSFVLQKNRNIVISPTNPLNQPDVTIESGYSAILDVNYSTSSATGFTLQLAAKTVALTKEDLSGELSNSRVTSIFSLMLQYKIINLQYRGHLVYDPNVSRRRELSQFMGFGLKLDL